MIASAASFGSFRLIPGAMTRTVPPTADAPILPARPQPSPAYHSAAIVTLAPAAMAALLQAQEGLSQGAPPPVRTRRLAKSERRISRLIDEPANEARADEGLFAERRLRTAPRRALRPRLSPPA